MNLWVKIVCLDCGVNCELLMDDKKRVICRECLNVHEFKEENHYGEEIEDQETYEPGRIVLSREIQERINPEKIGKKVKGQLLDPRGYRAGSEKEPKHELRSEGFELPENWDTQNIQSSNE